MGSNERASGFFRVPLHYPRYTRKEYEDMPEGKLDRVLAEYGLSANGDLSYKRKFAMGAFLWPNFVETPIAMDKIVIMPMPICWRILMPRSFPENEIIIPIAVRDD
ncbi:Hypothetical predicted protein [Olea europaea subsp. europaea]|uniref:DUF7722 domain-containing protein n=1 Tax=Olea europaea subsp. europaea TaxID=158383 RepID=A0A8S0PMY8_OLEEU|nr:Hypothetical predicted protein [Olea europaea subsp. europaea]